MLQIFNIFLRAFGTRYLPLAFFILVMFSGFNAGLFAQSPVIYSTPGTYTFTVPACVTSVKVQCWGAGGGGGGANEGGSGSAAAGGGGGGFASATINNVSGSYTVKVGAGGTGGVGTSSAGPDGTAGGNSSFTNGTITVTADGGGAGGGSTGGVATAVGAGGSGAFVGVTGTTYKGGNGGEGNNQDYNDGGAGGGGAGNAGAGQTPATPGENDNSVGGDGGTGNPNTAQYAGGAGGSVTADWYENGGNGSNIGGGGGGGGGENAEFHPTDPGSGGNGGNGQVIITYTASVPVISTVTGSGCSGSTLSINGTLLMGATSVKIGSTALTNLNITSTVITATIPSGASTGTVTVVTPCGTANSSSEFIVYPAPTPVNLGTRYLCGGSYVFGGHTYTTGGTYSDTATSVNGCDSITTITLLAGGISHQAISKSVCAGSSYNFGGHTYDTSGTYTDTATSSVTGCDSFTTLTLNITPMLNAAITQSICAGGSYSFGGHTYNTPGTFTDTATSTVTGCDSFTSLTLSIIPVLNAAITQSVCTGSSYSFGGHTYSTPGTYADTAISTVTGCDSITTLTLNITPALYSATMQSVCAGGSYNFNGTIYTTQGTYADTLFGAGTNGCDSISALILSVNPLAAYSFNDSICNGASYNFNGHSYTSAGTYGDTISGGSVNGCDSIVTLSLILKSASADSVSAAGVPAVFCSGDSSQLCATAGFSSYKWSVGDTSACFYTTLATSYSVTATDISGCTATSRPVVLSYYPIQSVSIAEKGDTLTSYGAVGYQWFYDNEPIAGDTENIIIATQTGDYAVQITDTNHCNYISAPINFTVSGLNTPADFKGFNLYPNPNSGSFTLAFADNVIREVEITDATGRIILPSTKIAGQKNFNLDQLAMGLYLLFITENSEVKCLKFNVIR